MYRCFLCFVFFFFNATATTEIYTLSLHDALPISKARRLSNARAARAGKRKAARSWRARRLRVMPDGSSVYLSASTWNLTRSEEHTSELQSQSNLVCRLLLEKKKKKTTDTPTREPS